jgi:hypothetical protein
LIGPKRFAAILSEAKAIELIDLGTHIGVNVLNEDKVKEAIDKLYLNPFKKLFSN